MIYYFSATGNNKYVATKIAEAIGCEAVNIQDCKAMLPADDTVGFVVPTYALGLPDIVKRFFAELSLSSKPNYVFFLATYGTTPGLTGKFAEKFLAERGISIDAYYSIKMPDNWTATFDLSNPEKVAEINKNADALIEKTIELVRDHKKGNFMQRTLPYLIAPIALKTYENMRKTSHFKLDETCIGCGLCERKCPDRAIRMEDKKPVWVKERCEMCLGCLHRCPKFAIQYEDKTRRHGQYKHPEA